MRWKKYLKGFTLAELLIALAILGVIAMFTIPKILQAQQDGQSLAKAKEVAGMISGAYQQAKLLGVVTSSTKPSDLTPYLNYVAIDLATPIDDRGNGSNDTQRCNTYGAGYPCIKLHNGSLLLLEDACSFNGTSSLHFMQFRYDPDGQKLGPLGAHGPSKSVWFDLYYDGFLTTREKLKAGSICTSGTYGPAAAGTDPDWFIW